jgi:hypothetical protein
MRFFSFVETPAIFSAVQLICLRAGMLRGQLELSLYLPSEILLVLDAQ